MLRGQRRRWSLRLIPRPRELLRGESGLERRVALEVLRVVADAGIQEMGLVFEW